VSTTERDFPIGDRELFAILIDPATYPEWLVGAKRIRDVSPRWPAPKSDFRHVVGFGPLEIPDRTTVVRVEPPDLLELHVRARPLIEAKVRFEIAATPSGCRLTMTETPVGIHRLVRPLVQPLVRARNARSLDRLAAIVDGVATSAA
jgi:hypothetical protein